MKRRMFLQSLAALGLAGIAPRFAHAEEEAKPTISIQVSDMHCGACAKKIARKLFAVAGVVKVKTDLKKHTAWIVAQKDHPPAPRALWEAVEKAGFKPVLLATPEAQFREKPDAAAGASA